eukprot:g137.t1
MRAPMRATKALRMHRAKNKEYERRGGVGSYDLAKSWRTTKSRRDTAAPLMERGVSARRRTLDHARRARSRRALHEKTSVSSDDFTTSQIHKAWEPSGRTVRYGLDRSRGRDELVAASNKSEFLSTQIHSSFAAPNTNGWTMGKSLGRDTVEVVRRKRGGDVAIRRRKFGDPVPRESEGSEIDAASVEFTSRYGPNPRVRGVPFGRSTSTRFVDGRDRSDAIDDEEDIDRALPSKFENIERATSRACTFGREARFSAETTNDALDGTALVLNAEAALDRVRPDRAKGHRYLRFDRQLPRFREDADSEVRDEGNHLDLRIHRPAERKAPAYTFKRAEERFKSRNEDDVDDTSSTRMLEVGKAREALLPERNRGINFGDAPPRWGDTSKGGEGDVLKLRPVEPSLRRGPAFSFDRASRFGCKRKKKKTVQRGASSSTVLDVGRAYDAVLPSTTRGVAPNRAPRWKDQHFDEADDPLHFI